uniref:phenylalanine--tRNA ligase n=1 Tax=Leptosiphonia brodiei TaxID=2608611 RepID=A0A1Z1MAL7_9FLOR|nr:Phenylalanine-tRNA ligase beta subunit [Leptosiphonia brodiei]ARW62999.1 Phenylalanine-tRNA ligase beta subunit [Leptosiphonia brodiei]
MRFSWQLTNSFLKMPHKNFQKILNKLILSGIEVDKIENMTNDKILDLNITTNRKEINSAFSLARELSILTNNKIQIKRVKFNLDTRSMNKLHLNYVRIQIIDDELNQSTPQWILEHLKIKGETICNNLENIQKYIYSKWGTTFKIIKMNEIDQSVFSNNIDGSKITIKQIIQKQKTLKTSRPIKILVFSTEQKLRKSSDIDYDVNEFYENYYSDSINIIKDSLRCTVGKYYEYYKNFIPENNTISIGKNTLNNLLGSSEKTKIKFLENQKIREILKNLKFLPKYIKEKKIFIINTPKYRKHDIKHKIDIVEEIGKIHEFQNFYNKYKYKKLTGKKSEKFVKINKIRRVLRNIGLNEVINSSLANNSLDINKSIKIHNPINEEQKHLRNNIIDSLISNYIHHKKYTDENLLIFEIGKTFQKKNLEHKYIEAKSLGALIYAPKYHRKDWREKPNLMSIFHAKGILELFLEQINADIYLDKLDKKNDSISNILKKNNIIGIYNKKNHKLIGILGEINNELIKLNRNNNEKVYIFEIKLDKLISTTKIKNHLNYSKKLYSEYPSITRDISIPMSRYQNIDTIKNKIVCMNKEIIESIEIFNEYKTIESHEDSQRSRFVGIRIKYRSLYKTLNTEDIRNIDNQLSYIMNSI